MSGVICCFMNSLGHELLLLAVCTNPLPSAGEACDPSCGCDQANDPYPFPIECLNFNFDGPANYQCFGVIGLHQLPVVN